MECPICGARAPDHADTCMARTVYASAVPGDEPARIVEGSVKRGPVSAQLPLSDEDASGNADDAILRDDRAWMSLARGPSDTRLAIRLPALPATLWRQPAVRAVASASVGAVALTFAARLLHAWVSRPRAVRGLATSAWPLVADMLDRPEALRGTAGTRPERGAEVVETVVYMQRVVRRQ